VIYPLEAFSAVQDFISSIVEYALPIAPNQIHLTTVGLGRLKAENSETKITLKGMTDLLSTYLIKHAQMITARRHKR